ncbi:MAG: AAA family ATPase [Tepidiformaceae bacterium]
MTIMAPKLETVGLRPLLEREDASNALETALTKAVAGRGRMLAIGAEAGGGKTALLDSFRASHPHVRILRGGCDALATPRPLSPLLDIRAQCDATLGKLIGSPTSAHEVASALLIELGRTSPTVLVLEDVHWADEATIDLIRVLARRIETVPALVIVSFRTELDISHPLMTALGDLGSSAGLQRLTLHSLSARAVATMAERSGIDAAELYERTGGNPFFVTEVLASLAERIPTTIREAVLARAGRLSLLARAVLETVAVIPPLAEHWLLEEILPGCARSLEECLASGTLVANNEGVLFRHELAREAIEGSLSPTRCVSLNRCVLRALTNWAGSEHDLARLAHHAELASDGESVLRFAAAAGEKAAAAGAHREAAAQFARAIRWADPQPAAVRVHLLDRRAAECFLTDDRAESILTVQDAILLQQTLRNPRKEGELLASMSRMLWCAGRIDEAWGATRDAAQLLEPLGPSAELARTYSAMSMLLLNDEDAPGTAAWGERALSMARMFGDGESEMQALTNVGTIELLRGNENGRAKLKESLRLAELAGLDEHVARAWAHLAWAAGRNRDHSLEATYFEAALDLCRERDLDLWRLHVLGYVGSSRLQHGRWREAADIATLVAKDARSGPVSRIHALTTLALLRARRGDPQYSEVLWQAEELAAHCGQIQHLLPVATASAEIAWLNGKTDAIQDATDKVFDLAVRKGATAAAAELARWRVRAGIPITLSGSIPRPYRLEIEGRWAAAAEEWNRLGCAYEAALAQVETGDENLQRVALRTFDDLGAVAARSTVLRRLRLLGVRGLPTGPRPSTRENPWGLTRRETDILQLLKEGCSNSHIARQLILSTRTVDHHVSSILGKLDSKSRTEAVRKAAEEPAVPLST